jgi:hypothetical protein
MSLSRLTTLAAALSLALVLADVFAGAASQPAAAAARHHSCPARPASALSCRPIAQDASWRRYVLDQGNGLVYPKHVYVVGDASAVDNPAGLEAPGGGVATIHATGQGTPQLVLDLGINTGGYVEVGITKSDGTTVHLGYSEARRFLTPNGDNVNDPSQGDPGPRSEDVSAAGDWRSPGIRGAERWISLQLQSAGTVSIDYVRVREEHLRPNRSAYTGHFLSSDDQLNRVWYASAYTFALDSWRTDGNGNWNAGNWVIFDGAKRDRNVWLGDLVVENMLGAYALSPAPSVMRNSIQMFSCQQGPDGNIAESSKVTVVCPGNPPPPGGSNHDGLTEYTAWWVIALHDYEVFTGDDAFAQRMLPVARRALGYYTSHLDSNGLYPTPSSSINWHPFDVAGGEDAHTNATIYRALVDTASLERRIGAGEATAAGYDREAAALREAMLAHLWDSTAGAFLLNGSDPLRDHTQDAQVEAVLDGVVTGDQAASALSFISSHLRTTYGVMNGESSNDPYMSPYISPFISSTELLARLALHDTSGALDLLRREWGHMVDTDPNTTVWERMDFTGDAAGAPYQVTSGVIPPNSPAGRGFTSLAHGWAGGPVAALSGYVLGIRPTAPGFSSWIVEPQVGDLRFAQGQAPTPHGPIVSRWRRGRGSFVLTAGGPRRTTGQVAVPLLGAARTIARDGVVVWNGHAPVGRIHASADGSYVRFSDQRGLHTYAWGPRP